MLLSYANAVKLQNRPNGHIGMGQTKETQPDITLYLILAVKYRYRDSRAANKATSDLTYVYPVSLVAFIH